MLASPIAGVAQTWQWATGATGATAQGLVNGQSFPIASAQDPAGNTVITGNFSGTLILGSFTLTSAGDRDVFVAWLSPTGTWLQAVRAGGPGKDLALTVALDANGSAVIGGSYTNQAQFGNYTLPAPAGSQAAYVARLSFDGSWTQALPISGSGQSEVRSLVLDANNSVIAGGYFSGASCTFGAITLTNSSPATLAAEGFVAWLDASSTWQQALAFGGSKDDLVTTIALDDNNNVLVGGIFYSPTLQLGATVLLNTDATAATTDLFVGRLSRSGSWLQAASGGGTRYERLAAVVPQPNGGLAIAASFASPVATFGKLEVANARTGTTYSSYDLVVARLNAAGAWTQAVQAGGPGIDIVESMSAESSGTLTVAGHFNGTTLAFGSTAFPNAGPDGTDDLFVARLAPDGTWARAVTAGSTSDEQALSVNSSGGNDVTVSGWLGASTTFGNITVRSFTYGECFAAHLTNLPLPTHQPAAAPTLGLTPNPAAASAQLLLAAADTPRSVVLLDALGREVRRFVLPAQASTLVLNLTGLPGGGYVLRCGPAVGRLLLE